MDKKEPAELEIAIPAEVIERKIYLIRGHKVMLDSDLAELYEVLTKNLNLAVRRIKRITRASPYKRNGTATLFAALNTHDGTVISMCDDRHRHQEWLKFLGVIDYVTPQGKSIHLIADNYATHKHPKVQRWLERHPRFHVYFTPTSISWLK